jgi:hypothetical protein
MGMYPLNTELAPKVKLAVGETARLAIAQLSIMAEAAADDAVLAAVTLGDDAQEVTDDIVQPDVPREITVTGALDDGATPAGGDGDVVIDGTDAAGAVISETITAVAGETIVGDLAFATVTAVTVPSGTGTIAVGTGSALGIPARLSLNTVLAAYLNEAREATAPTVATSPTVLAANTITLNSALDGSVVDVLFLV